MRAVLDVNVIVSALLSRTGTPAVLLIAWMQGAFELVVSPRLLAELKRVLAYPKIARYITTPESEALFAWLELSATVVEDPATPPPVASRDPGDDYLIALAVHAQAMLVTGDEHLTGIEADVPILTAARFRTLLDEA